jgi:hypothetical protein
MHTTSNSVTVKTSVVPNIKKKSCNSPIRTFVRKSLMSVSGNIVVKMPESSARWCCCQTNMGKRGIGKQVVGYRGRGGRSATCWSSMWRVASVRTSCAEMECQVKLNVCYKSHMTVTGLIVTELFSEISCMPVSYLTMYEQGSDRRYAGLML